MEPLKLLLIWCLEKRTIPTTSQNAEVKKTTHQFVYCLIVQVGLRKSYIPTIETLIEKCE